MIKAKFKCCHISGEKDPGLNSDRKKFLSSFENMSCEFKFLQRI